MRNTHELLPTPPSPALAKPNSAPSGAGSLTAKQSLPIKKKIYIYVSARKPPPLSPPPPGEGEAGSLRAALFCCLKATQPRPGLQLLGSRRSGSSSARPGPAAAPGDAGLGAGGSSRHRPAHVPARPHTQTPEGQAGKAGGALRKARQGTAPPGRE